MGIFSKRTTREGAIAGMIIGILFTMGYIIINEFVSPGSLMKVTGISSEGIGAVGMILNFLASYFISRMTPEPPIEVQEAVERIRHPGEDTSPAPMAH
jgi:cation/acetate symporter